MSDKLIGEWCQFDEVDVKIDDTRTFDWYLSNEIIRLANEVNKKEVLNLGDGNIFQGALNTRCNLVFKNEIQQEMVVTKCYSMIDYGEDNISS